MASKDISLLWDALVPDPWRATHPFSQHVADCHDIVLSARTSRERKSEGINEWLKSNQPCLFGRAAATRGWLEYCVLTDNDFLKGSPHVRAVIQEYRLEWKRRALKGERYGFLILALGERIALAAPSKELLEFALGLEELYLGFAATNDVHLDEVQLRIARLKEQRVWDVGVNVFGAQADGRWWQDHTIPGGIAFSMNSVGHMARSIVEAEVGKNRHLREAVEGLPHEKLAYWALPFAMRTIDTASKGARNGTWLLPRGTVAQDAFDPLPDVRATVLRKLKDYSEHLYRGHYDTDQTVPEEYFRPTEQKPEGLTPHDLPFTYIFDRDDPKSMYEAMGIGNLVPPMSETQGDEDRGTSAAQ